MYSADVLLADAQLFRNFALRDLPICQRPQARSHSCFSSGSATYFLANGIIRGSSEWHRHRQLNYLTYSKRRNPNGSVSGSIFRRFRNKSSLRGPKIRADDRGHSQSKNSHGM